MMKELRVSGATSVQGLAGSIVKTYLDEGQNVKLTAVGAAAVNQAVKGITIARGILARNGLDVVIRPGFNNCIIEGAERTMMVLILDIR